MLFTLAFTQLFAYVVYLSIPLLFTLALTIIILGQIVGRLESWQRFDAFYWSFITATTIGYGDFRPKQRLSRLISIFIGFTGIILTGILVAIAIHSATFVLQKYYDSETLEKRIRILE